LGGVTDETPSPKKQSSREDALAVVRRLREAGHVAYFAGGCVRDQLLGLEPKDYDVATDAPPERVRELFPNTQAVGAAFGVILVRQRRSQIEVATFRTDGKYVDGRRPEGVTFSTAEEDAKRRDFTINGMFFDPVEERVIDYVGGEADVKAGVLRAIGEPNHRFEEDHLRLLRAVRFASRFGMTIEPVTAAAIAAHAEHLKRISPERIADELRMMLGAPTRTAAWSMLWEFRLVDVIFRHLHGPATAGLVPERSLIMKLSPGEALSFGEVLAAATTCYRWQLAPERDIVELFSRPEVAATTRAMRQALKISNEEAEELSSILEWIGRLLATTPTLATKKRFLGQAHYPAAMEVMEALASVGHHASRIWPLWNELTLLQATECSPPPLVTGDDLTAAGLAPGPLFKRVLDAVYDAQLEDRVRTKDEAMKMAMDLAGQE
jgi:tRNA nucleotidyltransferase/poly(A) polymerase